MKTLSHSVAFKMDLVLTVSEDFDGDMTPDQEYAWRVLASEALRERLGNAGAEVPIQVAMARENGQRLAASGWVEIDGERAIISPAVDA